MKLILSICLTFSIFGCYKYSDESPSTENKEKLSYSFGYNNSEWKIYNLNNNEITFIPQKYDQIPKIMKLDVQVNSKNPKINTIYMWYGGPDNQNSNGETPMTYNPISLVNTVNLAEINKDYNIYPPKDGLYRAWSIPDQPIAMSNINNQGNLDINLYIEPETYLSIVKKDIYLIDNNNSFVERKYKTSYGIYGGLYYGMKFIKHDIFRRVVINAHSSYSNSDVTFDSDFITVSTTYE